MVVVAGKGDGERAEPVRVCGHRMGVQRRPRCVGVALVLAEGGNVAVASDRDDDSPTEVREVERRCPVARAVGGSDRLEEGRIGGAAHLRTVCDEPALRSSRASVGDYGSDRRRRSASSRWPLNSVAGVRVPVSGDELRSARGAIRARRLRLTGDADAVDSVDSVDSVRAVCARGAGIPLLSFEPQLIPLQRRVTLGTRQAATTFRFPPLS